MKTCSRCGAPVQDEARFCGSCGYQAAQTELGVQVTAVNQPSGSGMKFKFIIGAILAVVLLTGGFLGWNNFSSQAQVEKKLELAVKYLNENNYEEAILAYNEAIKIDPKNMDARIGLAQAYVGKGDFTQANKAVADARAVGSLTPEQYQNLIEAYSKQGQLPEAEALLSEARQKYSGDNKLADAEKVLIKMRDYKGAKYGNTPGNLNNWGTAVQDGDWIYFANTGDRNRLYRIRVDGTDKQKLFDEDPVDSINVNNGWIYCIAGDVDCGGYIYRLRTDGGSPQQLSEDLFTWICFHDGRIYYQKTCLNGEFGWMNTDGTDQHVLDRTGSGGFNINAVISDKCIYYSVWTYNQGSNMVSTYRMSADGSGKVQISSGQTTTIYNPIILQGGDWIYYTNVPDNSLYRMRTDGSGSTLVLKGKLILLNISGDRLYYTLQDEKGIFRMRLDGSDREKITNMETCGINIVPDWIYFSTGSASMDYLYRVHPDGKGLELVGKEKPIQYF